MRGLFPCAGSVVCCERRVFRVFSFLDFVFFIGSCKYVQRLDRPYLQVSVNVQFVGNKISCLVLSCLKSTVIVLRGEVIKSV